MSPSMDDVTRLTRGPVLAPLRPVRRPILLTLGAGVGALLVRQHRESQRSGRLAAAALEALLNAIDANDAVTGAHARRRSEEHTSELQSRLHLVCRLLLEKTKNESS